MPDEPEAVGLLALMLLTEARRPARTAADGSMIRLADQDRTRWDRALIAEGPRARARLPAPQPARPVPDPGRDRRRARRRRRPPTTTDWSQIVALYDQLYALRPNAVVALNRAIAIAELHGPAPVSPRSTRSTPPRSTTTSRTTPPAPTSSPAPANRPPPRAAYDRAIELTTNPTERAFLAQQTRLGSRHRELIRAFAST